MVKYNIVFAADKFYAQHLAVALTSLLVNNGEKNLNIYIINGGLPLSVFEKFKKISEQGSVFEISQDRYVDFVSLQDIAIVVNEALNNQLMYTDINIVYQNKILLSDLLYTYCQLHNISTDRVVITGTSDKHYTGNGDRLASLGLNLEGILPTLQRYKHGSI